MNDEYYRSLVNAKPSDANDLVDKIREENNEKFTYILDVGCGNGEETQLLSQKLEFDKIIAIDTNKNLIEFAQTNYSSPKINYFVDDISLEWEQLSDEIKKLEGKISLIFSNKVLHWIDNKRNAAINFYRLLTPTGKLYSNFHNYPDLIQDLMPEEKSSIENIIRIPSKEEQIEIWRNVFMESGFKDIRTDCLVYKLYNFKDVFERAIVATSLPLYKKHLVIKEDNINDENIKTLIINRLIKSCCKEVGVGDNGVPILEISIDMCRVVTNK